MYKLKELIFNFICLQVSHLFLHFVKLPPKTVKLDEMSLSLTLHSGRHWLLKWSVFKGCLFVYYLYHAFYETVAHIFNFESVTSLYDLLLLIS